MKTLRIIGDVHGRIREYIKLASTVEYSIQLGDMGFDYTLLKELDPKRHKILGGNHDNYRALTPHFLSDFGTVSINQSKEIFYVRGGYSVDREARREGLDWFPEEQIGYGQAVTAFNEYHRIRPRFVISHECPATLVEYVSTMRFFNSRLIRPSMTANLLDSMYLEHRPESWLFGHHHRRYDEMHDGCRFVCLEELGYLDFEV